MTLCCATTAPMFLLLWPRQSSSYPEACVALFGLLGTTTFTAHVLTSLAAREACDTQLGSTAMGVVKGCGQLGGALAGAPVAVFVSAFGWPMFGAAMACCCVLAAAAYWRVH